MKIYLCRHGETTGDIEDRYGGDYDDHLTDKGKSQSNELAEKLKEKGIEKIFVSPRIRAQETAEIVSNALNIPLETVEDIRERNAYGILTGMIKKEAFEKYPTEAEALKSYKNTIEGAEDYKLFTERILRAFNEIANKNYSTVAILTHGGPIHCFFREVIKNDAKKINDCGFIELEKDEEYKVINSDGLIFEN